METNKEIPTAEKYILEYSGLEKSTVQSIFRWVIPMMNNYRNLHLSKQAEVIAEKAKVKMGWLPNNPDGKYMECDGKTYSVNKQSILQAGEEYINNLK